MVPRERHRMKDTLDVKLDPERVYEAISDGVSRSMTLDDRRLYDSISEGVHSAIWQMIRSGTDMPGADFRDSIEKAARQAFEQVALDK